MQDFFSSNLGRYNESVHYSPVSDLTLVESDLSLFGTMPIASATSGCGGVIFSGAITRFNISDHYWYLRSLSFLEWILCVNSFAS